MSFILLDGFWVVYILLVRMVKFKFLAHFSVDHFPHTVSSHLIYFFALLLLLLLLGQVFSVHFHNLFFFRHCHGLPVLDGYCDIPNRCWGKQPPWWYQLGWTKRFYGSSLSREHHSKEQQTQHNATKRITFRLFHFSTDKPSTRDTILPKKIRKVTIQHQRRRGKNRQTLAETNQKKEKVKRKYSLTFSEVTNLSL